MGRPDYAQQVIPGLDLSWLSECVNEMADARDIVDHMRKLADCDELPELRDAIDVALEAMLAAERVAMAFATRHGHTRGIVGDIKRDGPDARKPIKSDETATKSDKPCRKCGAMDVWVDEIGDNPDYSITCRTCRHHYCVDGSDG